MENHYSNIVIIVYVAIDDLIYIIEGIYKIPTVDDKKCRRTYDNKRNRGTMDIFKNKHVKKKKVPKT